MKVAVLGSGIVGEVLSNGFLKHGYEVIRGSRDPDKLKDWLMKSGAKASTGTFQEASKLGELIVLAVKGSAAKSALGLCVPANLKGKTIIDVTNPIGDTPPVNGVLPFFTDFNSSLMERLQRFVPDANFVKAFNSVANVNMVNPTFSDGMPTMFVCGNNERSKGTVREILTQFGWEAEDLGTAEAARAIEPLCMLLCIPGLLRNDWKRALRLLKT